VRLSPAGLAALAYGSRFNAGMESADLFGDNLDAIAVIRCRWRNLQPERSSLLWGIAVFGLLFCSRVSAEGQQDQLVGERQVKTLARALAYDENLLSRAGRAVVLAVLYKVGNAASEREAAESSALFAKLESYNVLGLPFHSVKLPFTSAEALDAAVGAQGLVALYVCPGMEGEMASIKRISRRRKATTIASREEQVTAGLALGVFLIDRKLTVIVNLPVSQEEGARFGSDLLRLAKVIQ
jgi:hypothetical protein